MWHMVGGEKVELTEEITMGTSIVKPDGTVKMSDGTEVKLKEGNIVNTTGKVIDVAALRQKAAQQKAAEQKKSTESTPESE